MPKYKTISMSDLSRRAERIATDIEASGAVYRITRRGHRPLLVVDSEYIESLIATIDFMTAHPDWRTEMAQSRNDLAEGRCITLEQFRRKHDDHPAEDAPRKHDVDVDDRAHAAGSASARKGSARRTRKALRRATRSRARAS